MRNALKAHIDKGGEGLSPLFLEAAAEYFKGPKWRRKPSGRYEPRPKVPARRDARRDVTGLARGRPTSTACRRCGGKRAATIGVHPSIELVDRIGPRIGEGAVDDLDGRRHRDRSG